MERAPRARLTSLVLRAKDGDRSALRPLFDAAFPLVLAVSKKMIARDADAEDAAQETMTKLFARLHQFDGRDDAAPWIVAIAAWECRTVKRRMERRRERSEDDAPDREADGDPEREAIERETAAAARAALGALAPRDVETIRAMMGEIERPDVAPATFRKRLERALAKLRGAWGHET